jgi:hypothetical protein
LENHNFFLQKARKKSMEQEMDFLKKNLFSLGDKNSQGLVRKTSVPFFVVS